MMGCFKIKSDDDGSISIDMLLTVLYCSMMGWLKVKQRWFAAAVLEAAGEKGYKL